MEEPLPHLQYATPVADPLPAGVRALAIVGICLASMTLLTRFASLLGAVAMLVMAPRAFGTTYSVYQLATSVVFSAFAAWLLAASIGCLRRAPWGRRWILRYAMMYPVALIADVFAIALIVAPSMSNLMATTTPTTMATTTTAGVTTATYRVPPMTVTPTPTSTSSMTMLLVGQAAVSTLVLLIFPAFIVVIMRKPAVRAAFAVS